MLFMVMQVINYTVNPVVKQGQNDIINILLMKKRLKGNVVIAVGK